MYVNMLGNSAKSCPKVLPYLGDVVDFWPYILLRFFEGARFCTLCPPNCFKELIFVSSKYFKNRRCQCVGIGNETLNDGYCWKIRNKGGATYFNQMCASLPCEITLPWKILSAR